MGSLRQNRKIIAILRLGKADSEYITQPVEEGKHITPTESTHSEGVTVRRQISVKIFEAVQMKFFPLLTGCVLETKQISRHESGGNGTRRTKLPVRIRVSPLEPCRIDELPHMHQQSGQNSRGEGENSESSVRTKRRRGEREGGTRQKDHRTIAYNFVSESY